MAKLFKRSSAPKEPVKQVRLKLVYIDFWSAVKLSFLIAICGAVLLLVATMDAASPRVTAAEPPPEVPEPPVQWTAETDLHAQRILRLESRRTAGPAPLR